MKKTLSLLFLMCLCAGMAWGQTRSVSGRVTSDSTKQPLSGVSVSIKGANTGTATDEAGQFSLAVPETGNPVLVFSYIGYNPQEIAVGQRQAINLSLTSAS